MIIELEKKHFTAPEMASMEKRYRAAFINSLGGFKSVVLVGTRSGEGQTNLAIFNSLFHIGSHPPLCGLIFRPDSVSRHTLENIMETGVYTINHIHEEFFKMAHQTSARYDRSVSEFGETGLTEAYHETFFAPYVQQSHLQLGMQKVERVDLAINGTILLIGRIVDAFVPVDCIREDGSVDIEKSGTLTLSGLDSYHKTLKLARLSYPKPGWPLTEI